MSIPITDKFKPKGVGGYPLMDAEDILMPNGTRLSEWKPESGGGVSSWNDLTDKPFGEEGSGEVLLEEQNFSFSDLGNGMYIGGGDATFSLVAGETYLVRWDDKEYTCVGIDVTSSFNTETIAIGNGSPLGLPGDEPFAIMIQGTELMLYVIDGSTLATHKVGISRAGIKTLDAKYLPMDAIDARIEAKLAEIPDVSEVGM